MNELLCPKCKREEGTTSFVKFDVDENNHPLELRACDDEGCKCEYEVRYEVKEVAIRQ